jgi:Oxoglutarate and iron-dependent oxygenase degradation C-term
MKLNEIVFTFFPFSRFEEWQKNITQLAVEARPVEYRRWSQHFLGGENKLVNN